MTDTAEPQAKPRKGPKPGYKDPVKYRGPNGETWTGRGRLPKFIKNSGKDKAEFKINAELCSTAAGA